MKSRTITTTQERTNAIKALMAVPYPYVMTIGADKVRSTAQNSRYWSGLDYQIGEITGAIEVISSHTGFTPLEVRKLAAREMEPEKAAILFATNKEAVHNILKMICGVETSTRLGTKQFMKFETIIEATLADIAGDVLNYMTKAVG